MGSGKRAWAFFFFFLAALVLLTYQPLDKFVRASGGGIGWIAFFAAVILFAAAMFASFFTMLTMGRRVKETAEDGEKGFLARTFEYLVFAIFEAYGIIVGTVYVSAIYAAIGSVLVLLLTVLAIVLRLGFLMWPVDAINAIPWPEVRLLVWLTALEMLGRGVCALLKIKIEGWKSSGYLPQE